jgi:hypothetical protein
MTDESPDLVAGTETETAPGVGGLGDHPAPAAMRDADGELRVHGETESTAGWTSPAGDGFDLQVGEVTDESARERLDALAEPEPFAIERPDIGTE